VPRSREDLLALLWDQLEYLKASAASYDAGFEGEAKRLAVVIRVLLYNSRSSTSLLETLAIRDKLGYWQVMASAPPNALGCMGLTITFTEKGIRYLPSLREQPKSRIAIDEWWNALVIFEAGKDIRFSRGNGVLEMANTDGGAHVDPTLNAAYKALSRDNSFGWEVRLGDGERGIVENSPVPALVRTAAHELHGTLLEQLPDLLPEWSSDSA
jgi:hypothetical protein